MVQRGKRVIPLQQFDQGGNNHSGPGRGNSSGGSIPWLVVILAFMFFWPIGLFLLIKKLSEPAKPSRRTGARAGRGVQPENPGRRQNLMSILGGILLAVGAFSAFHNFQDLIFSFGYSFFWESLWDFMFSVFGLGGAGLGLLLGGRKLRAAESRYQRYLAYIGKNTVVSVEEMAGAMGVSAKTAYRDLEKMLERGDIQNAYLDYSTGELVFAGAVREKKQPPEPPKKQPPQEEGPALSEHERIIQEIIVLNRDIEDPEVSKKIDRIEYLTRRIFQQVEQNPGKKQQIDKFMNYYLPNTLKILRAYAQFEAQEIQGENIAAAMRDIEEIMDKLVAGYEKQLDRLFADEAVDISTDITVLEGMLAKDGFTGEEDFKLK